MIDRISCFLLLFCFCWTTKYEAKLHLSPSISTTATTSATYFCTSPNPTLRTRTRTRNHNRKNPLSIHASSVLRTNFSETAGALLRVGEEARARVVSNCGEGRALCCDLT